MALIPGVTERQVDTIRMFNEQVDELDASRFVQFLTEQGSSFRISAAVDKETTMTLISPDREATKAFVLTMRMFFQNNESISIGRMATLMTELPISDELRTRFLSSRKKLNDGLDNDVLFKMFGVDVTRRRVFDTFLYGGLAHLNWEKVAEYKSWQNPPVFGMVQVAFNSVVTEVLKFLRWARHFNREVLRAIGADE